MTTWLEGKRSLFLGAQAVLFDNTHETAASWATPHVITNPAYAYVLGRFVEADRANSNRQLFALGDLQMARPTITHAPMNMNHSYRRVVGAYVATDLIYPTEGAAGAMPDADMKKKCPDCEGPMGPDDKKKCADCMKAAPAKMTGEAAGDQGLNPYIEALGVFWKHYFPEEYALVEAAHAEGRLYYSMECVPGSIQCAGPDGCGEHFQYAGQQSPTYCEHLNQHTSDKLLIDPHFTAGAILVPPVQPGWANADIHSLVAKHAELAERIYDGVASELSHLDPREWEMLMTELLVIATR